MFSVLLLISIISCCYGNYIRENHIKFSDRITGGRDAPEGAAPHQVSLQQIFPPAHFCGGSILNENWIVSAAHCSPACIPGNCQVEYATNNLREGLKAAVKRIVDHPDYVIEKNGQILRSIRNDITLLNVESPLQLGGKVKAISLNPNTINNGDACVTTGWGRSDRGRPTKLQIAELTVNQCEEPNTWYHFICLSSQKSSVCGGDSGGPLICQDSLSGITSYAHKSCLPGYSNGFTRVSKYITWIESVIG